MQTTREPSATREGWVDITLDLVLTKFGRDPGVASNIAVETNAASLCFANVRSPNDCLLVAWGSQEQFETELRPWLNATEIAWPPRKAMPYPVTFEVPENASRASLIFDESRVTLNLQGDRIPTTTVSTLSPAPTPAPAADYHP